MTLQWLISTYGDGIKKVENLLLNPEPGISYLISHQDPFEAFPEFPPKLIRNDVQIFVQRESGLSKNRNHALRHATADILVVADDDIGLNPNYPRHILRAFQKHPEVDVACFQIRTPLDQPAYKKYPKKAKMLTRLNQMKAVSSIEIAFRRKSVQESQIWFDERFGLGATASSGEEFLFLAECLRKNLKIMFFPIYIVEHPYESSVKNRSFYDKQQLFSTGAQCYVLFKDLAYLRNVIAACRRYPTYRKAGVTFKQFLKAKNEGSDYAKKASKGPASGL
ncbi:MAG TPA: glycosyltransferase family A protein [Bacteroidales bacterium]|nr:glycosyltransferase family A protein [Bacteroidales bacterium]